MNANKNDTKNTWVDPDDAPELTNTFFESADLYEGEKLLRKGRTHQKYPAGEATTVYLSTDVLRHFRSFGTD